MLNLDIYAMDGQPLVQLKRELFTFLTEYVGKDQGNREVLRVSQKFSCESTVQTCTKDLRRATRVTSYTSEIR